MDSENREKLQRYVFPIIEKNEGWGSAHFTEEHFRDDPLSFQSLIDFTVWDNVHIVMENNEPVALLEYDKKVFPDQSEKSHLILKELLEKKDFQSFNDLVGVSLDPAFIPDILSFLNKKSIYSHIGVVLTPSLQGKKTGISEKLYNLLSDGIVFGYTSNPMIVRQRRKTFKNTLFFPLLKEFPASAEEWAICLYTYADRLSETDENHYKGLELGALTDPAFVEDRGELSLSVARAMAKEGKITTTDEQRIQYVLSKKFCAGAIVSWN